jgi:hypothetical protein
MVKLDSFVDRSPGVCTLAHRPCEMASRTVTFDRKLAFRRGKRMTRELIVSAQPFARATSVLREATAIVQRRPLRGSRMPSRLLAAANRAMDEELQLITQELRNALQALHATATLLANVR